MIYLLLQWYIILPVLLCLFYWHGTRNFSHWRKLGVKHIPPEFFFGNIRKRVLFRVSFHELQKELYFSFAGERVAGIYEGRRPVLMVRDPELIRLVMVRDFDHFVDRPVLRFRQRPSVSNMLISLQGAQWKSVRAILTPTFTSGKIKSMSLLVMDVGKQMVSFLNNLIDKPDGCEMEMKDFFGRFTLDVIASCAFGVQCDSLQSPDAEFAAYAGKFNDIPLHERMIIFTVLLFCPQLARFLPLSFMNKGVLNFLESVVRDTKERRIKEGIRRNDFLQLMIDALESEKDEEKSVLNEDIVIAQAILFLLAGFETSSTVLCFTAFELALNPDIQSKLREEISRVLEKHGGECNYDAVQEMEYLDMVIHESMRKHPPVARMDRKCTKEYAIPDTNITLKPDASVTIPVMGLHYDSQYYPDPERFDPLRFSSEEKAKRSPYVYLPFGSGPRNCIGARFALTSTKMALVYFLQDFGVEPCSKTKIPYAYSKFSMLLKADKGIWLNIKRLANCSNHH
ncbi:Cytochrome P450 9e2 [Frankliniella fusca]|uniref:Cytochrome P450 9e2 n=1 Tax=Frankliniella fusca TaxID=407009 RepID=A0AAE1L732_9NEOP|nr:Cytochrome P450 9e2 [Frankliniella fusca]